MIIWINGTFGCGKTSVSNELHRRLENSYVYDPEEIGFFIRDNLPSDLKKRKIFKIFVFGGNLIIVCSHTLHLILMGRLLYQ